MRKRKPTAKEAKGAASKKARTVLRRVRARSKKKAATPYVGPVGPNDLYRKNADGTYTNIGSGNVNSDASEQVRMAVDAATSSLGQSVASLRQSGADIVNRIHALCDEVKVSMTLDQVAHVRNTIDIETAKIQTVLGSLGLVVATLHKMASDPLAPVPPLPLMPSV